MSSQTPNAAEKLAHLLKIRKEVLIDSGGSTCTNWYVDGCFVGTEEEGKARAYLFAASPTIYAASQKILIWVGKTPRKEEMEQYAEDRGAFQAALASVEAL